MIMCIHSSEINRSTMIDALGDELGSNTSIDKNFVFHYYTSV